ncbi:hypothetical protein M9H77_00813 [Catharanthus roseus]|uniref:Uncharacterized protein n=1 Tax=Catharanthus roseus TaxID=4058 RepID=A0ACC0C474_CATRO|nr:hypothetical protein M9H77_00813 [Catharanthus roseus]
MSSIFQSFQGKQGLPLSRPADSTQEEPAGQRIRRRLSSLSLSTLKIQYSSNPASSSWAFRRSKSVSSMGQYAGDSIRSWWDWGWAWILSRKPTFAKDLELNEEETAALGCHNKGSWRHVFYKIRSELRKLLGSDNVGGLPQTFRYDSYNYYKNFDDSKRSSFSR